MKIVEFDNSEEPTVLPELPWYPGHLHYSGKAINDRVNWTEAISGTSIRDIRQATYDPEILAGNIENYIGTVQVPVGIAGPLLIDGKHAKNYIPVTMATTEGALVSSLSRGAKACSMAGGIKVHVKQQQMLRAPVFFCHSMQAAIDLEEWIFSNRVKIKRKAESLSKIAKLKKLESNIFGDTLHVLFYYTTGDAAGQNMTTAATWCACEWIAKQVKKTTTINLKHYFIDGNASGDKKTTYRNFIIGRGISVTASCQIPADILKSILHIGPEKYLEGWQAAEIGALQTGMVGSNINFANVIAGVFTATGQDIGCVPESSNGVFKVMPREGGLLFTASLPSLVIGTVGGGTDLPTQNECLQIMGCAGSGKVFRLAEIIAAACLALDLSTGAAIGSNDFVAAHEKLGRNRPIDYFSPLNLDTRFMNTILSDKTLRVLKLDKLKLKENNSIITSLSTGNKSATGIHRYCLSCISDTKPEKLKAVLKLKHSDNELLKNGHRIAKLSGDDNLPGLFTAQAQIFGFENSSIREIEFYSRLYADFEQFCPKIFGTKIDTSNDLYAVLMEDLTNTSHLNTVDTPSLWTDQDIKFVLSDMAIMHSIFFKKAEAIPKKLNIPRLDEKSGQRAANLLDSLTNYNAHQHPSFISEELQGIYLRFIDSIGENISIMKQFPMTLVHNDFNPRNLCLRNQDTNKRLVLYDWELVSNQNPQVDLVEFLIYVLPENYDMQKFYGHIEYYRKNLNNHVKEIIPKQDFIHILYMNALYLATTRYNLYLLAHNILGFKFLNRVYANLTRCILNLRSDQ